MECSAFASAIEVPGRGLEPLRISPPDPKSGASANFATLASVAYVNRVQEFTLTEHCRNHLEWIVMTHATYSDLIKLMSPLRSTCATFIFARSSWLAKCALIVKLSLARFPSVG